MNSMTKDITTAITYVSVTILVGICINHVIQNYNSNLQDLPKADKKQEVSSPESTEPESLAASIEPEIEEVIVHEVAEYQDQSTFLPDDQDQVHEMEASLEDQLSADAMAALTSAEPATEQVVRSAKTTAFKPVDRAEEYDKDLALIAQLKKLSRGDLDH